MKKQYPAWFAIVLLASIPIGVAHAIDFDATITQIDGMPFPDGKPEDSQLRKVVVNALLAQYPDEQNLEPPKKMERYFLAKKIQESRGDLQLTAEETALVKTLVAKGYPTLIVGQAWLLLDPASVKK